jgi:hypothetical protein
MGNGRYGCSDLLKHEFRISMSVTDFFEVRLHYEERRLVFKAVG